MAGKNQNNQLFRHKQGIANPLRT